MGGGDGGVTPQNIPGLAVLGIDQRRSLGITKGRHGSSSRATSRTSVGLSNREMTTQSLETYAHHREFAPDVIMMPLLEP